MPDNGGGPAGVKPVLTSRMSPPTCPFTGDYQLFT
jgi:hypothetical protein